MFDSKTLRWRLLLLDIHLLSTGNSCTCWQFRICKRKVGQFLGRHSYWTKIPGQFLFAKWLHKYSLMFIVILKGPFTLSQSQKDQRKRRQTSHKIFRLRLVWMGHNYCPQTKLLKGNVFRGVCLSRGGRKSVLNGGGGAILSGGGGAILSRGIPWEEVPWRNHTSVNKRTVRILLECILVLSVFARENILSRNGLCFLSALLDIKKLLTEITGQSCHNNVVNYLPFLLSLSENGLLAVEKDTTTPTLSPTHPPIDLHCISFSFFVHFLRNTHSPELPGYLCRLFLDSLRYPGFQVYHNTALYGILMVCLDRFAVLLYCRISKGTLRLCKYKVPYNNCENHWKFHVNIKAKVTVKVKGQRRCFVQKRHRRYQPIGDQSAHQNIHSHCHAPDSSRSPSPSSLLS